MRFAAYAGASTVAATAVIFHAFNQRPNFYSAIVYLAQSQACRMILLNLALLSAYTVIRSLQKLLYGPLRAIEREQIWDKSWYAVTETALAMTTFRDEVGAYFLVMFVMLLAGKVWAWLSEGRVEILEQQPPANPRRFHARMLASLFISELFDLLMLRYCVNTLINQPRPGMMVMFAFEFAVLFITSSSITLRYVLSLQEILVVKKQTLAKIEERKEEIRAARADAERQAAESGEALPANLEREEDIDENEIDVPGWQEKGRWVLFLDLFTDFMKLVVYMFFFAMLLLFHGIPIHIIRDVYLTTRSFLKRINDFQKYRNATKDMNARYPDATAQELSRDGTCIICREDMQPWQPEPPAPPANAPANPRRPARSPPDERQRPKRLPCGHVLHLGCLKSWLERQQVCPTCRTSVLAPNNPTQQGPGPFQAGRNLANNHANMIRGAFGAQNQAGNGQQLPDPGQQGPANPAVRARQFRLGPWRFTFAAGEPGQIRDTLRQLNQPQPDPPPYVPPGGAAPGVAAPATTQQSRFDDGDIVYQLRSMEQSILAEMHRLQLTEQQLQGVRRLQTELMRVRLESMQQQLRGQQAGVAGGQSVSQALQTPSGFPAYLPIPQPIPQPRAPTPQSFYAPPPQMYQRQFQLPPQAFAAIPGQAPVASGSAELPSGFSLPQGWSLMPLQRLGQNQQSNPPSMELQDIYNLDLPDVLEQIPQAVPTADEAIGSTTDTPRVDTQPEAETPAPVAPETNGAPPPPKSSDNLDLPDWGASGTEGASDEPANRETQNQEETDTTAAETPGPANGHPVRPPDKGKGRAPRVEDAEDDGRPRADSGGSLD